MLNTLSEKILSIIIPSYNMGAYLPKCLDSLECSNIDKLDILVVNDGSKDDTLDIACEYKTRHPGSITVIDKSNGNYGSCINAALKQIKGKYVKVLDADDSFAIANLDEYLYFLDKTDADMTVCDYCRVNEAGNMTREIRFSKLGFSPISFAEALPILKRADFQMHAVAYRSNIFKAIDYRQTEGMSYTDMEWMFAPMTQVKSVAYFPQIIYRYLVGREGQTVDVKVSLKAVWQTATVLEAVLAAYTRHALHSDTFHLDYLHERIRQKAPSIYRIYLLKQTDTSQWKRLKEFDIILHDCCPKVYAEMEAQTVKAIPFHYITYWRNNYSGKSLPLVKLIAMLHSIIS